MILEPRKYVALIFGCPFLTHFISLLALMNGLAHSRCAGVFEVLV